MCSLKMVHLKLENINSGYGKNVVLKDINFQVKEGEFIGVIGPNGAGKSTLFRTITRIIRPFSGQIYVKEEEIKNLSYKELAKRIACVSQESFIPFSYKVWDIVMMGRFPYQTILKGETDEDIDIVKRTLNLTDTELFRFRDILSLSSGERQRVMIARALVQEPEVLFLDEPTSHLDIGHQMQIFNILKKINREQKMTIVAILHDLNLAAEYCDKLLLLDKGRIFKFDTPQNVLNYKLLEAVYNTLVIVKQNPISNKPYVIVVSKGKGEE